MKIIYPIKFQANFNNKLNNKIFTTIRPNNEIKYTIGNEYSIENNLENFRAKLLDKKTMMLHEVPDWMFYLDTGYSKAEALKIFQNFYSKRFDINKRHFDVLLLKNISV